VIPGLGSAVAGSTQTTPVIRGAAQISSQSSGSTFSPILPTHVAGDVLLVFASAQHGAGSADLTASGWSVAAQVTTSGGGRLALFYKTAPNSSQTITINNAANKPASAIAYALKFAGGGVTASGAAGADPPSVTASWGFAANFWMVASSATSGLSITAPTGFGDVVQANTETGGDALLTTADKADGSATLDPSAFGGGPSGSLTAVVQPA
jgi:hypothetical protein